MLLKGSRHRVLSGFRVKCGRHCASLSCWNPSWSLKKESTSPAVAYACTGNYSYILNVEHQYRTMPSQSPHLDTTPVVLNVRSLANRQNQQKRGLSGNSQLPPATRCVSVPAGERDSTQGGSSVASTIQGQNSVPSSSLNNSRVADISQRVTSTQSARQRWSINTPTATPVTSSHSTPAPGETTTRPFVSSPAFGIAITPTPLRGLENLPTLIPNPEAHAIITNPLRTRATEKNQRQRQWQLQPQAVSTPWSMVSGSRSIHRFGHSDMTCLVFATGRVLELYMWNRRPFMSGTDLETVSYATRPVSKALAEAPHWQIIETYWNTAMQQNNIWSIAFEAHTKEILKEVCWSNGPHWILHAHRYQVRSQVDKVKSHFIQSARDNIAELYDLNCFESAAEHLEFIDSLLADNKCLFPVAEHVEGGVRGPNPKQRESKAANEWPASTSLPIGSNAVVYLHQILSSSE